MATQCICSHWPYRHMDMSHNFSKHFNMEYSTLFPQFGVIFEWTNKSMRTVSENVAHALSSTLRQHPYPKFGLDTTTYLAVAVSTIFGGRAETALCSRDSSSKPMI